MATDPAGASAPPGARLRLEHWVFGAAPEVGYSVRARSAELNLALYSKRLDGLYAPLRGEALHNPKEPVDALMVQPTGAGEELLLTFIGPGPPDEIAQRPTIASHTVVLPVASLRSGALGFEAVERAVRDFDRTHPEPLGTIDSLEVPLREPAARPRPGAGIARHLSRASAETLLTRWLSQPEGRTLILCRDTTTSQRRQALYRILETLPLACRVPFLPSLTEIPSGSFVDRFQLVVSARAFRTDNTWVLLDCALESPTLARLDGEEERYAALAGCYAPATGAG